MKKTIATLGLAAAVTLLSSCASVVSDSEYPMNITSTPAGSSFVVYDNTNKEIASGKTPEMVTLPASNGMFSKATYTVKFTTNSGEEKIIPVTATLDGWFWGNLFIGGPIGVVVDGATGAMWELPASVNATLSDKMATKGGLKVVALADIPADQIHLLTPIK